jgi:predicted transcriptional regulator
MLLSTGTCLFEAVTVARGESLANAMKILAALREGQLNSSRLAQRCNINYGRLAKDLEPMHANGWVAKRIEGEHEVHRITDEGLNAYAQYMSLWNAWERGTKLTSGQEAFKARQ